MVDEAAARWLRGARGLWWWRLPADQFRIAMEILATSTPGEGGKRMLVTTHERLAAQCGVDRGVIRRALAALEAGGFCTVSTARGSGGSTTIGVLNHLQAAAPVDDSVDSAPISTIHSRGRPFETTNRDHLEVSKTVCESPAIGGDHGHLKTSEPTISGQILDLDLRSKDLSGRSSTPQDLTNKLSQPAPKKSRKQRVDPDKISLRAWQGADYMRSLLVKESPNSMFAAQPWGGQSGRRLAWANSLQRLHDQLARAANVLPMDAAAMNELWDEIARTVFWLYNSDPSKPNQGDISRFVVESPDSLTAKWDKIQMVRRNQLAAARARSAPRGAAPDNRPAPEYKRWGDENA